MKALSATSAKATGEQPSTGQSSARLPSPIIDKGFSLAGPSDRPDPAFHAYRRDLADVELAGRVVSSHYAAPVARRLSVAAELRAAPSAEAEKIAGLNAGDPFMMLDDTLGWAWGYAGAGRLVGYVNSESLTLSA